MEFAIQIGCAVRKLQWQGLIVRRRAANRCSDVEISQNHSIVAIARERLAGKSDLVQNGIHEIAGGVTGKWTACAIRTVCSRS